MTPDLTKGSGAAAVQRVGIVLDGFMDLAGARDFIVAFVDGMQLTQSDREIVLLLRVPPQKRLSARLRYALGQTDLSVAGNEMLDALRAAGLPDIPCEFIQRGDRALQKAVDRLGLDVVGPLVKRPGSGLKAAWFGYLFDFQHKYMSEHFSQKQFQNRDRRFGDILQGAYSVVVNAKDVKRDVAKFFPGSEHKVVPLSLSAAPKPNWFDTDIAKAQETYSTGSQYFIVSNQFWLHKNHETVIDAFAQIATTHPDICLVLTGDTFDPRSPTRLSDIEELIAKLGLTDRVLILGLIPKLDQIALMRGSISVVQPTSFEGGPGGGSVFDAISLGVPTIVSDITINREIEPLVTRYFKLNDVSDLAEKMQMSLSKTQDRPETDLLVRNGVQRRELHGHDIWRAIDLAAHNFAEETP